MSTNPNNLPQQEVVLDIAKRAYTYGFPLVMMHLTKLVQTNVSCPQNGHAPLNQMGKAQTFPTSNTTDVVKPNVDTYYNIIWFDLSVDDFVLNVPSTLQDIYFQDPDQEKPSSRSRYYLLPFLDAYSNVFTSPGTRITGSEPSLFFITGPDSKTAVPNNMQHIQSPTNMVWMLGRIQVNDDADGAQVAWPIQQQLNVTPFSEWNNVAYTSPITAVDSALDGMKPVQAVFQLSTSAYFNLMSQLMDENPPPERDASIVAEMNSIGLIPGSPFNINSFAPDTITALQTIPSTILSEWEEMMPPKMLAEGAFQNNWVNFLKDIGDYGTDYLQRAFIAYKGLGANIIEDAIYPVCEVDSERAPLMGGTNYKITMTEDELPEVHAFWSLTAYNEDDFLVANEPGIYSVGSRGGLLINDDKSVDIYIQPQQPADETLNWLPSPESGKMSLTMRLYWPGEKVLHGIWKPPTVEVNPDTV